MGSTSTACTECVVIGVQSIKGSGSWDYEDASPKDHDRIRSVIKAAFTKWNVDLDRVMMFGFSRGGTQSVIMNDSGDLITHISEAGAGGPNLSGMTAKSPKIKLYFQAGEFDNGATIAVMTGTRLKSMGYSVFVKIWPGKGHSYGISENGTILEWFLHGTPPTDSPNCCLKVK